MTTTPRLTVIIVNYNVEYFLQQCLFSVRKAAELASIETIVVDNDSSDGSCEMVRKLFPEVQLIANKDNLGFSKANNQAMRISKADYVLLLNPDTLVEEDTFQKCIEFMDAHPDAGGLGVKMVDGRGHFLKESKRGLPTPMVAFYKIFGLSNIFPKSKTFGQYHLGHLSKDEISKVDILAGAYMMMRKSVLDQVGLLDEDFFMYGEDIDLSWRIKLGGYENYYFPNTRIIHYKGESTKKSTVNYVMVFYNAMIIFAKKHFSKSNASVFEVLIRLAIYFRAGIALVRRFLERFLLPALDYTIILVLLFFTAHLYSLYSDISYPKEVLKWIFPIYSLIFLFGLFWNQVYNNRPTLSKIFQGMALGGIIGLITYSLLDENYRFSRFVMLLGGMVSFIGVLTYRFILSIFHFPTLEWNSTVKPRVAIVGKTGGIQRVRDLLSVTLSQPEIIVEVYPGFNLPEQTNGFTANLGQLTEVIRTFKINQVIYCGEDINSEGIINEMIQTQGTHIEHKIAPPESAFIIGSQSINAPGEILALKEIDAFNSPRKLFLKRMFDLFFSILALFLSPLFILFQKNKSGYLRNVIKVLLGFKTWVGITHDEPEKYTGSKIKNGVLHVGYVNGVPSSPQLQHQLNLSYMANYNILKDISIIWHNFAFLGI